MLGGSECDRRPMLGGSECDPVPEQQNPPDVLFDESLHFRAHRTVNTDIQQLTQHIRHEHSSKMKCFVNRIVDRVVAMIMACSTW